MKQCFGTYSKIPSEASMALEERYYTIKQHATQMLIVVISTLYYLEDTEKKVLRMVLEKEKKKP